MKKVINIVIALCVLAASCVIGVGAVSFENGGIYEVPITLIHAEKDKTSMGDKYIFNTALIEVKNGTKYLTMVTDSNVSNLNFWYYNDGSVSGDTTEAEKVSNIEISGETYSVGYRFPLCGEEQLVGVKFSASIMPMTPSARVKIDYDSAKPVSAVSDEKASITTAEAETEAAITEQSTKAITEAAATEQSTEAVITSSTIAQPITTQISETVQMTETAQSAYAAEALNTTSIGTASIKITIEYPTAILVIMSLVFIAVALLIIFGFIERKQENDR